MRANVRIEVSGRFGQSVGSGVVLQKDGEMVLALTNRHVVDGAYAATHGGQETSLRELPPAKLIFVTGDDRPGRVVWLAASGVDLALIEAQCPPGTEAASWSAEREVVIGESVFAIGNPAGLGWSFSSGVVSALRDHKYSAAAVPVVQTDTKIGPGNSGGGLYNQRGELVGINTFIVNPAVSQGLGFAIRLSALAKLKPFDRLRLGGLATSTGN
jgi:serine protease Do